MSLRKPSGSKEGKQLFLKNNSILNLKTFSIKKIVLYDETYNDNNSTLYFKIRPIE